MPNIILDEYIRLLPAVRHSAHGYLSSSYEVEADVLYVNFKKSSQPDDSELTDDEGLYVLKSENRKITSSHRGFPLPFLPGSSL